MQGVENPRLNAEWILAHVLGISRIELYLQHEKPLEKKELGLYRAFIRRRVNREPLQYILGETEFMSLPFRVESGVLIPRPETELLVEKAAELMKDRTYPKILDIGTGSGCIAISLARLLPSAQVWASDHSRAALDLAERNAGLNGVNDRIRFVEMDIMTDSLPKEKFDMVVSNPPYICEQDIQTLAPEIRDHEPLDALNGGPDGLSFYKRFQQILPGVLDPQGIVLLEIGSDQREAVRAVFDNGTWASMNIYGDLAGLDRIIMLTSSKDKS
jgi:release factor glutamine methyltransferase